MILQCNKNLNFKQKFLFMNVKNSNRRCSVALHLTTRFVRAKVWGEEQGEFHNYRGKLSVAAFLPIHSGICKGHQSAILCHSVFCSPQTLWAWWVTELRNHRLLTLQSLCLTRWSFAAPSSHELAKETRLGNPRVMVFLPYQQVFQF
jgi:hypothetical protein